MNKKYAVVLDETLPAGVALNSCAHMVASLGAKVPEMIGKEPIDAAGNKHAGIPVYPNVILKASKEEIKRIVGEAREIGDILMVDYPSAGLTTSTDEEFVDDVSKQSDDSIVYMGVCLYGDKEKIKKLTGSLSLWR